VIASLPKTYQSVYKKKGALANFSVILKGSVALTYRRNNSYKNG
jgi:hypothetical protein